MKICLISASKPCSGSGDGMTDYAWELYKNLEAKGHKVDTVYALQESKRFNIIGNVYINTLFKGKIKELPKERYDIYHITNQELGFVAKILWKHNSNIPIVTTIHDILRFTEKGQKQYHKSKLQNMFNNMVTQSIKDAINFSDAIIFTASNVKDDVAKRFHNTNAYLTMMAPHESFRTTKIPKQNSDDTFIIGYIGAFSEHKNVKFILETAELTNEEGIIFSIYGNGPETDNLWNYKEQKNLHNVIVSNFVAEEDLLWTYDKFNLLYYPSLQEGPALPILDAQARGIPVLILKNNKMTKEITKYCIKADSPKAALKIIKSIKKNGYNNKKALAYARSFSWEKTTEETLKIYNKLIKG
jgi:glycosyltransferase involved in cell wall biosynthesis